MIRADCAGRTRAGAEQCECAGAIDDDGRGVVEGHAVHAHVGTERDIALLRGRGSAGDGEKNIGCRAGHQTRRGVSSG